MPTQWYFYMPQGQLRAIGCDLRSPRVERLWQDVGNLEAMKTLLVDARNVAGKIDGGDQDTISSVRPFPEFPL